MNKTFFTELSQSDLQAINGGWGPVAWLILGICAGSIDSFIEGFQDGKK